MRAEESAAAGAKGPDVSAQADLQLPYELAEGYQLTFARLRRMFGARGVRGEETADLAQETIVRTLLHLQRHPLEARAYPDGVEPLMKRIATNLLIDRARAAGPLLLPIEGAEATEATGTDPSEEVARRQDRQLVQQAIGDLSSRHRKAMLLSLEGLTPAEIAERLGIRRNAADALLYRARRSLAKQLSTIAGLTRLGIVLLAMRLRALGRRASAAVEPIASGAGSAALGLAAATLGATLSFATPGPQTVAPLAPASTEIAPASVDAAAVRAPHATIGIATGSQTAPRPALRTTIDARDRDVGTKVKHPTHEDEDFIELEVWQEEDGRPSIAGDALDAASDGVCGAGSGACDGELGA